MSLSDNNANANANKNRRPASLVVEEIRQGNGYGMESEILVRLSHPLFKGTLTRKVSRRELPALYEQLLGGKNRSRASHGSINASNVGLIEALLDGAHMDLGDQSRMTINELKIRTPASTKEVEAVLGSEYMKRRSIKLTSK